LQYWRSTGVAGTGGVIADREFQTWLDWLRADGELKQTPKLADLFTNEFNPYRAGGGRR